MRTPVLDALFSAITYLGDEVIFILIALTFLWCIDKRRAYFLIYLGLLGMGINTLIKNIFCIPRPWMRDPQFTIVEQARAAATGYSFPSGHTQTATTGYGGIALTSKHRSTRILCILAVALTAFSRLYLGVHTPADVLTSLSIGIALLLIVPPLHRRAERSHRGRMTSRALLGAFAVLVPAILTLLPATQSADAVLSAHGLKSAYTLSGATLGFLAAQWFDEKYLHYRTECPGWFQIVKLTMGFGLVMLVQTILHRPLQVLFNAHPIAYAARYFLVVLTGAALWPLCFTIAQRRLCPAVA